MTVGTPGDRLANTHWDNRFTCPECLTDHELRVPQDQSLFVECECGARLRCNVEYVPESICTIADPDEQEDEE